MNKKEPEDLCQAILYLDINCAKSLANLVMALASYESARSVVELSRSPLYNFQYSSICDAVDNLCKDEKSYPLVSELIRRLLMQYHNSPSDKTYRFNGDTSSINKVHSPTLKDRTYVYLPNPIISKNKPLGVGYKLSALALCDDAWQLPLSMERVEVSQTPTEKLLQQFETVLKDQSLPFSKAEMLIVRLDRAYSNAKYFAPSHEYSNLVSVSRFRKGQKIWFQKIRTQTGGRNAIYDNEPYYLIPENRIHISKNKGIITKKIQKSIFQCEPNSTITGCQINASGRKLSIEIFTFNDVLLRSKNGHKMSDKPINLTIIQTKDILTNEIIHQEDLYLATSGKEKDKLCPFDVLHEYQQRFDIEHNLFKFAKQNLFLQSFQSPDIQHIDNWFLVVTMAIWLLFLVAQNAQITCPKWQKYLPKEKTDISKGNQKLTIFQAYKAAQCLFLSFDRVPFLPIKSQKENQEKKDKRKAKEQGMIYI